MKLKYPLYMKNAIFTASSSYISFDCLNHLAQQGYNIAMHYFNNQKKVDENANKLKQIYPNLKFKTYKCNFQNTKDVIKMTEQIITDFKSVDLIINNASNFEKSTFTNITNEILESTMKVHLYAPLFLTQTIYNKTNCNFDVINMIDANIYSSKISDRFFGYLLSKKSLFNLTQTLSKQLAPRVRTNSISIGYIEKDFINDIEDLNKKIEQIPMKITTTIKDVVNAIDFILNNKIINGLDIILDGGEFIK